MKVVRKQTNAEAAQTVVVPHRHIKQHKLLQVRTDRLELAQTPQQPQVHLMDLAVEAAAGMAAVLAVTAQRVQALIDNIMVVALDMSIPQILLVIIQVDAY